MISLFFLNNYSENGKMLVCGRNDQGQIGMGANNGTILKPTMHTTSFAKEKILTVSCGGLHTIALTKEALWVMVNIFYCPYLIFNRAGTMMNNYLVGAI